MEATKTEARDNGWGVVDQETLEKTDNWNIQTQEAEPVAWKDMTSTGKGIFVATVCVKIAAALGLIYVLWLSLVVMGNAFTILAGKDAGESFRQREVFSNPIAALAVGVLVAVLTQSSQLCIVLVVLMVTSGLMELKHSIFVLMGANVGNTVINTIVSMAQISDKNQFRRAFAGATVHDCFNILSVIVLLPIEIVTGMLRHMSSGIVSNAWPIGRSDETEIVLAITKPFTRRVVQVDTAVMAGIATAPLDSTAQALMRDASILVQDRTADYHLFMDTPISDDAAGALLLIGSLIMLFTVLIALGKLLQSTLQGFVARGLQNAINQQLEPKRIPLVGDYILVLLGCAATVIIQSSSLMTSTLTPIVGIGYIMLDKMLALTVGANIGVTFTAMMTALASPDVKTGMTVALADFWFNIFGALLWFVVPLTRRVPLAMAKVLGGLAADLRWFPLAYILVTFGLIPGIILGLALVSVPVFVVFGILFLSIFLIPLAVLVLRSVRPQLLPAKLRSDPAWLPPSLRLEPAQPAPAQPTDGYWQFPKPPWRMAPASWGLAWLVIVILMVSLPNGQWASIKHPDFDIREHVGIGAWSICSAQYKTDMDWATTPDLAGCTSSFLDTAALSTMPGCLNAALPDYANFADTDQANEKYEAFWNAVRHRCTTRQWQNYANSMGCRGSKHSEQVFDVSKVEKGLTKSVGRIYKPVSIAGPGLAWQAGSDTCRPLADVCDNHRTLAHSGNLGWAGFVFALLGQVCLLVYCFKRDVAQMTPPFLASIAFFALSWLHLLLSWALFEGAVRSNVTCVVTDSVATGCGSSAVSSSLCAVIVTGLFGDMVDPSYSYGAVVLCWLLMSLLLILLGCHVPNHFKKQVIATSSI